MHNALKEVRDGAEILVVVPVPPRDSGVERRGGTRGGKGAGWVRTAEADTDDILLLLVLPYFLPYSSYSSSSYEVTVLGGAPCADQSSIRLP